MRFIKMHGCGNDYVLVDGFDKPVADPGTLARTLCNRHFGIGADGLLLIEPAVDGAGAMRIFNADGGEAEMCGNGIRCAARFLKTDKGMTADRIVIQTLAGNREVKVLKESGGGEDLFEVEMGVPGFPDEGKALILDLDSRSIEGTRVCMGNPHFVVFVDGLDDYPVTSVGPKIECSTQFEEGTNIAFVQVEGERSLQQRTWERGVGETLACGTGASAAVAVALTLGRVKSPATIRLLGGELHVRWEQGKPLYMAGPAQEVFRGDW